MNIYIYTIIYNLGKGSFRAPYNLLVINVLRMTKRCWVRPGQDCPDTPTSYLELHRSRSPLKWGGTFWTWRTRILPICTCWTSQDDEFIPGWIHKCLKKMHGSEFCDTAFFPHFFLLRFLWKERGKSPNPIMLVGRYHHQNPIHMVDVPLLGLCTNFKK